MSDSLTWSQYVFDDSAESIVVISKQPWPQDKGAKLQ